MLRGEGYEAMCEYQCSTHLGSNTQGLGSNPVLSSPAQKSLDRCETNGIVLWYWLHIMYNQVHEVIRR